MIATLPLILGAGYLGLNVLAFGAFWQDKHRAQTGTWRTPECTLLLLSALGPFGAAFAMKVFRHKTRHVRFWLVPLFVVLHSAALLWLVIQIAP